jgi:hypothetical protein
MFMSKTCRADYAEAKVANQYVIILSELWRHCGKTYFFHKLVIKVQIHR